jgi:hypothetical protein
MSELAITTEDVQSLIEFCESTNDDLVISISDADSRYQKEIKNSSILVKRHPGDPGPGPARDEPNSGPDGPDSGPDGPDSDPSGRDPHPTPVPLSPKPFKRDTSVVMPLPTSDDEES